MSSATAATAGDEEVALAGLAHLDLFEASARESAPHPHRSLGKGSPWPARPRQDEVSAWAQNACHLPHLGTLVNKGDKVKEFVGVGQRRGPAGLEGDAPLGIESDPGARLANQCLGGIDATHAGAGKLPGKEDRRLAISAADDQDPLGGSGDAQRSDGQRREGRRGQVPMIATGPFPAII